MESLTTQRRERLFSRVGSNRPQALFRISTLVRGVEMARAACVPQRMPRPFVRSIPIVMSALIAVNVLLAPAQGTTAVLYVLPVLLALSLLEAVETALDRAWGPFRRSRDETILRLARVAGFRDKVTGEHTERMSDYCYVLALKLGTSRERAEVIRSASTLHDIGKVAIPDRILLKPGPLTAAETAVMQTHAEIGFEMLVGSAQRRLDIAAQIALTHHERYDGGGYPRGLVGNEIPIEGRIAALADVFDALTSRRPYRAADTVEVAVRTIEAGSGSQFDPVVVGAFLASLDEILEIRGRYTGREVAQHLPRSRRNVPLVPAGRR